VSARLRRAAAIAGLALLAAAPAGCGDGDDDRDGDDAASTTSSSAAPSTETNGPTTTAAPRCPLDPLGDVDGASSADADVDGDGEPDTATAYLAPGAEWRVRVDLAPGGGAERAVAGAGIDDAVAVIGGADVDGDGADELWVQVGSGAAASILGLFRLEGCRLEPVLLDGEPARLPVGASVVNTSGVECRQGAIYVLSGTSADGEAYDVTEERHELRGAELVRAGTTTAIVEAGSPDFQRLSTFRCGGLSA
jgi:hypothetical protein